MPAGTTTPDNGAAQGDATARAGAAGRRAPQQSRCCLTRPAAPFSLLTPIALVLLWC
eukprot:COSAG01_NODE_67141_length_268_cov_0.568047_2_plen_57_part_01